MNIMCVLFLLVVKKKYIYIDNVIKVSSSSIVPLLFLVLVQRAAFSTGWYQRAKIFTTDSGNYGEHIILSATHMDI